MRILLVGPQIFYPWIRYTARALRHLGNQVTLFEETHRLLNGLTVRLHSLEWIRSQWYAERDRRLLKQAAAMQPDLILVLWGETFTADFLAKLKSKVRSKLVTWWTDDPFRKPVDAIFPFYDIFFIFDRSYIPHLREKGAPQVHFLPCACDETVYYPRPLRLSEQVHYGSEIAMVTWYRPDHRLPILTALSRYNLKVWGRGWTSPEARRSLNGIGQRIIQTDRFVSDHVAAKIYNATQIGLNIHSVQTRQTGLNTRSFELLATGAFELVDAVPGMEELLSPGREVVTYRSPEEAAELASYYLRYPEKRKAIAACGRERVLREHTYLHRMRSLLKAVPT